MIRGLLPHIGVEPESHVLFICADSEDQVRELFAGSGFELMVKDDVLPEDWPDKRLRPAMPLRDTAVDWMASVFSDIFIGSEMSSFSGNVAMARADQHGVPPSRTLNYWGRPLEDVYPMKSPFWRC